MSMGDKDFYGETVQMEPAKMQDEVNRLALNRMKIVVINEKVGIICEHTRIYDYISVELTIRFRHNMT